jgi:hypothetical protein
MLMDIIVYKYDFNEKYFELVDILQSKVFDDWDVISGTDERFDDDYGDDSFPEYKFWVFSSESEGLVSLKNLGSKIIRSLSILNIPGSEHKDFFKALKDLRGLVEDYTGMKLIVREINAQVAKGYPNIYDYSLWFDSEQFKTIF